MSPCMWKENRVMREREREGREERERDGHIKRQIQRNIFLLWKMRGVVEKEKRSE